MSIGHYQSWIEPILKQLAFSSSKAVLCCDVDTLIPLQVRVSASLEISTKSDCSAFGQKHLKLAISRTFTCQQ